MSHRKMSKRLMKKKLATAAVNNVPGIDASAHNAASLDDRTMMGWMPPAGSADADLLNELDIMVPRSRDMARNNGIASGANQTLKDNIIGSILRLNAKPDFNLLGEDREWAAEWAKTTEAEFRTWAETSECDAGRTMTLLGLTTQALGGALLNGEGLGLPVWLPRNGSRWGTRISMVESDRLATPPGMESKKGMRGGIEIDKYGAPLAYWLNKNHPGDKYSMLYSTPDQWERIPAFTRWGRRRVLHLHEKERTGQSRGKPIIASVMREFQMLGKFTTTELQAAIANSLIAAFIESDLDADSSAQLFGADPGDTWKEGIKEYRAPLKGGAVIPLPPGAKLSSHNPGRPNTAFDGFMTSVLRHMAVGYNIPYELFMKDFSKTNYSSARAALLEAWRYFLGQRRRLIEYWLNPIYELWLEEAINMGRIEAPGFYENRYAYAKCRWTFAGRGWVDPVKEANAAKLRLDIGLSTLENECAEQGQDWEEVLEQRAREMAKMKELGLEQNFTEAGMHIKPELDDEEKDNDKTVSQETPNNEVTA